MPASSTTRARPLLAVGHGYRSISPVDVAAAAAGYCDLLWLVDSRDPEVAGIVRVLDRLGTVVDVGGLTADRAAEAVGSHHPVGIVAYRDEDIRLAAALAERLGLVFHSPDVANRLVDKLHQRVALHAAGLPGPRWWAIEPSETDTPGRISYPVVVKPRRGSGSWHTFLVTGPEELAHVLAELGPDGDDEPLIAEEFLPSDEQAASDGIADYVSVESFARAGEIEHLAVTGRLPVAHPFRETGFFLPARIDPADSINVREVAAAAIRALGVRDGCLHTEIKFTPDGPRVIEVNGRVGGGIPDLLRLAGGVDLLRLSMQLAVGEEVECPDEARPNRIGYRFFYQPPAWATGVVSVDGLDELAQLGGVESVALHRAPGTAIDARHGTRDYVFSTLGWANSHAEVVEVNRLVSTLVHVDYLAARGASSPSALRAAG